MANRMKKLLVIGSVASGLFMAISACGSVASSHSSSQSVSSTQTSDSSSSSSYSQEPTIVLNSISVVNNKGYYERGEELDIVVTAHYSDGSTTTITGYSINGFNNALTGDQEIVVLFEGQTCSLSVSVREPVLVGITATSNKNYYEWGEELDISVVAQYSDGSTTPINDYQVTGFNPQLSQEQKVLVSYQGQTCSLDVRVNDPLLLNISVEGNKNTYEWGEELDISVIAQYSDGSKVNVDKYGVEGFDSKTAGEQTVIVKYEDKTYTFNVIINNPALISVTATNYKDSYEWGEDLELVVNAHYSDNSTKTITDYKVEGFDSKTAGEQTVTIKYEDKTYTFNVIINNPKLVSITAVSNKDSYDFGDDLDVTVYATYSDDSSVEITDYKVEGFSTETAGLHSLVFSYEGKTCSLNILVNEITTHFPVKNLKDFLRLENIQTTVPAPVSFNNWLDEIRKEQDDSNYFFATTKDEGVIGVDSIADQYAVSLKAKNWTIKENNGEFFATKNDGDVSLIFSTVEQSFTLRVEAYSEFPTKKVVGSLVTSKSSLRNGDKIILGNASQEIVVSGFDNGAFSTVVCPFVNKGPDCVAKNIWRFTINSIDNSYTLTDKDGRKLGATGLGQLAWDEGCTEWNLLISSRSAMILNTNSEYGRLCYNPVDGRITTHKTAANSDLVYPQMFKLSTTDLVYPTGITLKGRDEIGVGKTSKLSLRYVPENANSLSEVEWTSSDETVARVDEKGRVTGVSIGQATITARTKAKNSYLETSYSVEIKAQVKDTWTIMLYICGSNLESDYGCASEDIGEVLSVPNKPDDVNIIMETGGTTRWHRYNIASNVLSRYHVENQKLVLDTTLPKENMGKQSTFESFLTWGLQNYPADKTGIILWNHGGALGGCCYDDSIGSSDSLLNSETSSAFKKVFSANGVDKLEFIGYDACLMQIQDVAEFNSKYFNYMVGSEEAEGGDGWTYNGWIDELYDGDDTDTILEAACDSFVEHFGFGSDQTLSYLDLSRMSTYLEKFEIMASAIKNTVKNNYNAFKNLLSRVKDYGDDNSSWWPTDGLTSFGTVDGYDFLTKLGEDDTYSAFSSQITDAKTAYNNVVSYSKAGSGAGQSHGLAIVAAIYVSYPAAETSFNSWRSIFK